MTVENNVIILAAAVIILAVCTIVIAFLLTADPRGKEIKAAMKKAKKWRN